MNKLYRPVFVAWLLAMAIAMLLPSIVFAEPDVPKVQVHLTTLPQIGTKPQWRSSGVLVRVDKKIYIWGGYKQCFADDPTCSQEFPNTLQVYNLETNTWSVVPTTGTPPPGRTYHSMDVWYTPQGVPHIIIYGGLEFELDVTKKFISHADMWDFNTATNTWTQISAAATPGKRFGASFQIVGQKGYLFAGVEDFGGFNLFEHNDLWEYNFITGVWTRLITDDPTENPVNQPGSRYRANFDYSLRMNAIVLFGGDRIMLGGPDKPHRRDTWLLRLSPTVHWEKKSEEVDPVVDPVSAVLGTQHVVGFGDLEPQDNSLRCCKGEPGPTQFCDDPVKNIFSNRNINLNNSHYTKFTDVTGTTALKRAAYVKVGTKLYIWGGYNLQCSAPGANDGVLQFNTNLLVLNLLDVRN